MLELLQFFFVFSHSFEPMISLEKSSTINEDIFSINIDDRTLSSKNLDDDDSFDENRIANQDLKSNRQFENHKMISSFDSIDERANQTPLTTTTLISSQNNRNRESNQDLNQNNDNNTDILWSLVPSSSSSYYPHPPLSTSSSNRLQNDQPSDNQTTQSDQLNPSGHHLHHHPRLHKHHLHNNLHHLQQHQQQPQAQKYHPLHPANTQQSLQQQHHHQPQQQNLTDQFEQSSQATERDVERSEFSLQNQNSELDGDESLTFENLNNQSLSVIDEDPKLSDNDHSVCQGDEIGEGDGNGAPKQNHFSNNHFGMDQSGDIMDEIELQDQENLKRLGDSGANGHIFDERLDSFIDELERDQSLEKVLHEESKELERIKADLATSNSIAKDRQQFFVDSGKERTNSINSSDSLNVSKRSQANSTRSDEITGTESLVRNQSTYEKSSRIFTTSDEHHRSNEEEGPELIDERVALLESMMINDSSECSCELTSKDARKELDDKLKEIEVRLNTQQQQREEKNYENDQKQPKKLLKKSKFLSSQVKEDDGMKIDDQITMNQLVSTSIPEQTFTDETFLSQSNLSSQADVAISPESKLLPNIRMKSSASMTAMSTVPTLMLNDSVTDRCCPRCCHRHHPTKPLYSNRSSHSHHHHHHQYQQQQHSNDYEIKNDLLEKIDDFGQASTKESDRKLPQRSQHHHHHHKYHHRHHHNRHHCPRQAKKILDHQQQKPNMSAQDLILNQARARTLTQDILNLQPSPRLLSSQPSSPLPFTSSNQSQPFLCGTNPPDQTGLSPIIGNQSNPFRCSNCGESTLATFGQSRFKRKGQNFFPFRVLFNH